MELIDFKSVQKQNQTQFCYSMDVHGINGRFLHAMFDHYNALNMLGYRICSAIIKDVKYY